jgi:hypothetical protein
LTVSGGGVGSFIASASVNRLTGIQTRSWTCRR